MTAPGLPALCGLALLAAGSEALMATRTALPRPRATGSTPLEAALRARRSVREFRAEPLRLADLAQLLWAAQGTTRPDGARSAPSAGALYPLEVFVVAGNVSGLAAGVYRYLPGDHALLRVVEGDRRRPLAAAALGQDFVGAAPAAVVIAAVFERTSRKYGPRADRYVPFEAGCAAENLALQAVALGLGSVVVAAFADADVATAVGLRPNERPLAILPVGRPR